MLSERRLVFGILVALSGILGLAAGLSALKTWGELTGLFSETVRIRGVDTVEGTLLLASGFAAVPWAIFMWFRPTLFTVLANVAFGATALGATISAYEGNGAGVSGLAVGFAIAFALVTVALLGWAWRIEGPQAPIFLKVLDDFGFTRFFMSSFLGLLWALALAGALWAVFYVFAATLYNGDGYWRAILYWLLSILPVFVALLVTRLYLEIAIVLFRIYERLGGSLEQRSDAT